MFWAESGMMSWASCSVNFAATNSTGFPQVQSWWGLRNPHHASCCSTATTLYIFVYIYRFLVGNALLCHHLKCAQVPSVLFFGPQKGNKIPNHLQMPWDTCRPLSTSIMSSASPGHENKRLQNTTRHTITGALEITYIQMLLLNTLNSACEHKSIFKNKSWEVNRTWSIKMELHYPLFHHSTTCIYIQENKNKTESVVHFVKDAANTSVW